MKRLWKFLKLILEAPVAVFNLARVGVDALVRYGKLYEKIGFLTLGAIVILGVLLVAAIEATSTNGFCLLCHPYFKEEFYSTPHGKNGVSCADCHIPKDIAGFTQAKLGGLKEAWIYFTEPHPETRQDWYEEYKTKWEELAYEHNLKEEVCLECHGDNREVPYREVFKYGVNIHESLKVEEKGLSCFECHYNFVHGVQEWRGADE
ncbi:MAG TPA: hypothetical protein DHV12_05195 [Thermotogae bacterium]|nr:hypothetical protein [Thermotogota bacterium]